MAQNYRVRPGDCIGSIAFKNGFFWRTLWNHPDNSGLKGTRKDPNVLKESDVVYIPDLTPKEEPGNTEMRHRFRRKGMPAKLVLRILKPKDPPPQQAPDPAAGGDESDSADSHFEDAQEEAPKREMEPRVNESYILDIDGLLSDGQTDGEGKARISIPPDAHAGRIIFRRGTDEEEVIPLSLGDMDPVDTVVGARKRLHNLRYPCSLEGETMSPDLQEALKQFQRDKGLPESGDLDQATQDKLKEAHGC